MIDNLEIVKQVPDEIWSQWSQLFGEWLNKLSAEMGSEIAFKAASEIVMPVMRVLSKIYEHPPLLKSLKRTFQVVDIEWVEDLEDFVVFGEVMVPIPWFRDTENPSKDRREISIKPFVEFAKHVKKVRRILYENNVNNRRQFNECKALWEYAEKHNLPRRFIEDCFFFYFRDLIQYGRWKARQAPKLFPIRLKKRIKSLEEPLSNPLYHGYEGLPEKAQVPSFEPRPYRKNRQGKPFWGEKFTPPRPMPYFWWRFIEPLIDKSLSHLVSFGEFMYMEVERKPGSNHRHNIFFRASIRIPLGRFSEWFARLEKRIDSLPHVDILTIDPSPSKGAVFVLLDKHGFAETYTITHSFIKEVAGPDTPKLFPMSKRGVYQHHKLLKYYIVYSLAHRCDYVATEFVFATEKTKSWFYKYGWHKVFRNLYNIVLMRGGFVLFMPPGIKRCPSCHQTFSSYSLIGRNDKFGWLAQCPKCGFSAPKDMFDSVSNAAEFLWRLGFQLHSRVKRTVGATFHPDEPYAYSSHPQLTGNFRVFDEGGLQRGRDFSTLPRSMVDDENNGEEDPATEMVVTGIDFASRERFYVKL